MSSIAKELKIDISTVRKILSFYEMTLPVRSKSLKISLNKPPKYEQLKNLYIIKQMAHYLNKSVHYACKQTGFSDLLIKRYAKEFNITINKPFKWTDDIPSNIQQQIITEYVYNLSTKRELYKKYNISPRHLKVILKD